MSSKPDVEVGAGPIKVSVIVPAFNGNKTLRRCLEAIVASDYQDYECIVVDDCSGDGSQDLIASYAARYPRLLTPIYHKQNQGIAQTRIDALNAVKCSHVSFVDGDDRFMPTKLEKEVAVLEAHPEAGIVFSNYAYIDGDGERSGLWVEENRPPEGDVFLKTMAREFPKRSLFRRVRPRSNPAVRDATVGRASVTVSLLVSPPPRRGFTPDTLRRPTQGRPASRGRTASFTRRRSHD